MRARIATVQLTHLAERARQNAIASQRLTKEIDADTLMGISVQAQKLYMADIYHVTLSAAETKLLAEYA